MFTKAVKQEAKLRLALAGPSGSGKTFSSLAIATALSPSVALVDTEHGSASKYADIFKFDVLEMQPPFHPDRFIDAIKDAQANGYGVVILDSLTHAWNGTGGLLELVDQFSARYRGNTFAGWKEGTPIYNRLVDAVIQSGIHVIATMRSRQDYLVEKDPEGHQKVTKVGLAPIQRDGFEYEFDIFMQLDIENRATVTKTRCPELVGKVFRRPGKDVADIVAKWLAGAPHVERVDPLSDAAIGFAAKTWRVTPDEARQTVNQALQMGLLKEPFSKEDFKTFVLAPAVNVLGS